VIYVFGADCQKALIEGFLVCPAEARGAVWVSGGTLASVSRHCELVRGRKRKGSWRSPSIAFVADRMLVTTMFATASLLATRGTPLGAMRSARSLLSMSASSKGAYGFSAVDLESGSPVELSKYDGHVSLVVNVASK
jgi:hypothetical protein